MLAELLHGAGYATVWIYSRPFRTIMRGIAAGVWDGNQLEAREIRDFSEVRRMLAPEAPPFVALANFPRRHCCEIAKSLGVATVLGKPWINADLINTIDELVVGAASEIIHRDAA
jgi:hypothetical protein